MRAVIYARYSSDGQREESVEGQLRECKEFADRHNILKNRKYIGEYRYGDIIIIMVMIARLHITPHNHY